MFRSEICFRTTQELEYIIFCRAKRENFFQNLALVYMTKTLIQIFFFPPPKSEYFFQQHWESEYFFRNKPYPPFKLNGRSLMRRRDRDRMVVGFTTTYAISAYHH